jgi:predicted membrane channel-forming protein YqfA (hemolysin III family)
MLRYAPALLAFVANLSGIFLIKTVYHSTPSEPASMKVFFCFSMIAITWLLVVVPACYLTSRFLSKRALR